MAVYNDEDNRIYDKPDEYSPANIKELENAKEDTNSPKVEEDSLKQTEDNPVGDLNSRLQSFYKEDGAGNGASPKGRKSFLSNLSGNKKRMGIAAGAVGIPGLLFGLAFIPGLLSIFKIENFMQNIDTATFGRFNAAFDKRSDKWIKSYIKLRLTEIDGGTNGDNLFFRANKVDTDNPIKDWYGKLRKTNAFEQKVFEKSGIRFTTAEVAPGKFALARITVKDIPLNANLANDIDISNALTDSTSIDNTLNTLGPRLNDFVDVELYGSNKEARLAIKNAVNDNTKNWQVFKRRQLRRDIQNMTGIGNWRLFERTRDKLDAKKSDIQKKILRKVLPESRTGLFIGCLLGANKCPGQSDPASPETRDAARATAEPPDTGGNSEEIDPNGNTAIDGDAEPDSNNKRPNVTSPDGSAAQAADDVSNALSEALDGSATDALAGATPTEEFIKKLLGNMIGNPATKSWSILKKITNIHNKFADGTLSKMVLNSTRMQYMAAYASMGIALSQMKSGDIQGTESLFSQSANSGSIFTNLANTAQQGVSLATKNGQVSQYMQFFDGAEKSEAWILYSAGRTGNSAKAFAAEENSDKGREYYCKLSEEKKKEYKIHYQCPEDGLNGGKTEKIYNAYNNSVGIVIKPIAKAVNFVQDSFLGTVFNLVDTVVGKVTDPVVEGILSATGLGKTIENVMAVAMTKLAEFMGAGLKYIPGNAGEINKMMMGGATTAESTARLSGGFASTPVSLEYSNKLAAEWKKEKLQNMSTFEKYFALSNPESMASKGLMALVTSSPKDVMRDAVNPTKGISNYASLISGAVYADDDVNINASSVAEWAGVPTYDIPQVCIDLDPLSPDYLTKATNAPAGVPRDYAILSDSTKFWDAVYAELSGSAEEKEKKAEQIYNCAILDARVMGSLGYVQGGYDNDGGLDNSSDSDGSGAGSSDQEAENTVGSSRAPYAPASDALRKVKNMDCSGYWKVNTLSEVSASKKDSSGQHILRDDGLPLAAYKRDYNNSRISGICELRKSECLSGYIPRLSQKSLCETFKYYSIFYGANYPSRDPNALSHRQKTINWYGLEPTCSADWCGPAGWSKTWQTGLAGRSFLGCTGLVRIAEYDAYGDNVRPDRFIGKKYEVIEDYKDIKPGDIIKTEFADDKSTDEYDGYSHWVYAASDYFQDTGEIVFFHSSGYGSAAGFSILDTNADKAKSGGKNYYKWTDPNIRKKTIILRRTGF